MHDTTTIRIHAKAKSDIQQVGRTFGLSDIQIMNRMVSMFLKLPMEAQTVALMMPEEYRTEIESLILESVKKDK